VLAGEPLSRREGEPGGHQLVPPPGVDDPFALPVSRGGLHVSFVSIQPGSLPEPRRELCDETVGKHVRHMQDLDVDAVIGADVR
jgi:hypothetical protein